MDSGVDSGLGTRKKEKGRDERSKEMSKKDSHVRVI